MYVICAVFSTTVLPTMCAGLVSINILPDDVLLHIFLFDRATFFNGLDVFDRLRRSWRWHRLVQVCRTQPEVAICRICVANFLDLKLVCDPQTRVELIGIWLPLPIVIRNMADWPMPEDYDAP